jgi:hypothetical protein
MRDFSPSNAVDLLISRVVSRSIGTKGRDKKAGFFPGPFTRPDSLLTFYVYLIVEEFSLLGSGEAALYKIVKRFY